MIIGMTWLKDHNPLIDWRTGHIEFTRCTPSCGRLTKGQHLIQTLVESSTTTSDSPIYHQVNSTRENISTRLAIDELKNKKTLTVDDIKNGPFAEFADVFSDEGFNELPPHRSYDHEVVLLPEFDQVQHRLKSKIYQLSYEEQKELDQFLEENLKTGRIRPSKSPIASPVFFVAKKDGKRRMVIDYRKLNDVTKKHAYPLPLIEDLLYDWKGKVLFSLVDVRAGFHNIRIKPGDEWKTAFITNRGLYEFTVMPFGMTNSPATFQNLMNDVFEPFVRSGDSKVFIDDLATATFSATKSNDTDDDVHIRRMKEILQTFRENHLFLKPSKCIFLQPEIPYLGHIVDGKSIRMDPVKIAAVVDWPIPSTLTQVQSFLGFLNFYRRFIPDFAAIARPLNDLTKKSTPFGWTPERQEAFDKLRGLVTSSPILIMPDREKPFRVETDASLVALGAVLTQQDSEGQWKPIAYISRSFNVTERNYDVHDRELYAIIYALKQWRHYLLGAKYPVEVFTDHQSLLYFRSAQNLNRRQARWALILENYNLRFLHTPGKQNTVADALSRRSDFKKNANDNTSVQLLPESLFQGDTQQAEQVNSINEDIRWPEGSTPNKAHTMIEKAQASDLLCRDLQTTTPIPDHWEIRQGLWIYWGKIYIPDTLRHAVFNDRHSSPSAGHPGRDATLESIKRYYYWPSMNRDIADWVRWCDVCQRTKIKKHKPVGKLLPIDVVPRPWGVVCSDLITGLPPCRGFNAIWNGNDKRTKMVHIQETTDTLTSEGLHKIYLSRVYRPHGAPDKWITDRGPQYSSKYTLETNRLLEIETALSTAYHPQTDGSSERLNQEIEQVLRTVVNHHQDDWVDWLPLVEFALNNRYHKGLGMTPFYANYGFHPQIGSLPLIDTPIPSVADFVEHIKEVQKTTERALTQAAEDMKRFYDRHRGETPDYPVGTKVLLDNTDLAINRPSRKLSERRSGPFEIIEKIGTHAYRLNLPSQWKTVHPVFHVSKLEPYQEDPDKPNFSLPPPDIIEGEPEWEVEDILASKMFHNKLRYLVKWKGWPSSDNSWEPRENLENSPELLEEFHKKHTNAPTMRKVVRKGRKKRYGIKVLTEGGLPVQEMPPDETNVDYWPGLNLH